MVSELINILDTEHEIYAAFLDISIKKRDVILQNNIPELDSIVKSEHVLFSQLNNVERARKKLMQEVGQTLGKDPDSISINEVYTFATPPETARLDEIREKISVIAHDQITYNDINKQLIEKNLEYVNRMLSAVTQDPTPQDTYASDGNLHIAPRQRLNLFDEEV